LFINLKAAKEEMFSVRFDEILQVENNDGQFSGIHAGDAREAGA